MFPGVWAKGESYEDYVAREWPKLAFSEGHVPAFPSLHWSQDQEEVRRATQVCYLMILMALSDAGWINPSLIQGLTKLSGSKIRTTLEAFVSLGYVTRKDDRTYANRYRVRITDEGRRALAALHDRGVSYDASDGRDDPGSGRPDGWRSPGLSDDGPPDWAASLA